MTINFRRTILLLAVLLMISSLTASGISPKVIDEAGLFNSIELQRLEAAANELGQRLKLDLVVVTIVDNMGKTSRHYADDFYDEKGYGYGADADGALLLINMEDREVYISTSGIAIKYLTDVRIENILDGMHGYLKQGSYSEAVTVFFNKIEGYANQGIPDNQYTYDKDNNRVVVDEQDIAGQLLLFLAIAAAIGGTAVGVMAALNKGISSTGKHTYLDKGSFNVINSYDHHVNTQQTFVIIKKDPPSGGAGLGRSSIHRSSSGRSHGGGGRGF